MVAVREGEDTEEGTWLDPFEQADGTFYLTRSGLIVDFPNDATDFPNNATDFPNNATRICIRETFKKDYLSTPAPKAQAKHLHLISLVEPVTPSTEQETFTPEHSFGWTFLPHALIEADLPASSRRILARMYNLGDKSRKVNLSAKDLQKQFRLDLSLRRLQNVLARTVELGFLAQLTRRKAGILYSLTLERKGAKVPRKWIVDTSGLSDAAFLVAAYLVDRPTPGPQTLATALHLRFGTVKAALAELAESGLLTADGLQQESEPGLVSKFLDAFVEQGRKVRVPYQPSQADRSVAIKLVKSHPMNGLLESARCYWLRHYCLLQEKTGKDRPNNAVVDFSQVCDAILADL